jgi:4-diphosphocytidyl-2-C-methyl-D-erythritol kinase
VTSPAAEPTDWVRARAPGKINLALRVGPRRADGYHSLATVFQAVGLFEEIAATPADEIGVTVSGLHADRVPTDRSNLVVRAAERLAEEAGITDGAHVEIVKAVPVAGGMAGGSADAAATLLALDALWGAGAARDDLIRIAGELGADIPFCFMGHTAVATGRGDLLTPAMVRGEFHWVLALHDAGLSTPAVFAELDRTATDLDADPGADVDLMHALRAGDAEALGDALHNDLGPSAVALMPRLATTMAAARELGALGVVVSGSGPTVAALASGRAHAQRIAAELTLAGIADQLLVAAGPAPGAQLVG